MDIIETLRRYPYNNSILQRVGRKSVSVKCDSV